jgi:putative membrane protein
MLNRIVPALAALALIAPGFAADNGDNNRNDSGTNADLRSNSDYGPKQTAGTGDIDRPTTSGTEMQDRGHESDRGWNADHRGGTSSGAEALSQMDRDFIEKAASGGMFEVKSSQYLLDQKIKDGREKDFAQQMIDDHSKANKELLKLAEQKGLDVPKTLKADDQAKLDALKGQSGDVLQKTYDDQQRTAHQDAITLFRQEAAQGQDPDLKQFAAKTLPTLEKHANHLMKLEDTDRNLNLSK